MASELSPLERSLRARVAAKTRWAFEDAVAGTEPARTAFLARFEQLVDPEGVLPPEERARRAARLKSAYFTTLAVKSARARRLRAAEDREAGA